MACIGVGQGLGARGVREVSAHSSAHPTARSPCCAHLAMLTAPQHQKLDSVLLGGWAEDGWMLDSRMRMQQVHGSRTCGHGCPLHPLRER